MPSDSIFNHLLDLSQETFAQDDYETACHCLMAALDRASYLKDAQALATLNRLASDQLAALRQKEIPTRLTAEGPLRQQSLASLYHSIIQQATTWGQLVAHWRTLRQTHPSAPPPEDTDARP